MMTRKELLGSLMSKGVVVTNTLFENEDLDRINDEVENILEIICADETEEVPVAKQELIGRSNETTDVVHVLYPAEEFYPDLMSWASRMKEDYESVELKYFDDLDAFVFYSGSEDEAECIAEDIIDELE